MPARGPEPACSSRARIRAIDDIVLFKVKTGRWRRAVLASDDPAVDVKDWLVAAGTREEGSPDDFYAVLRSHARGDRLAASQAG